MSVLKNAGQLFIVYPSNFMSARFADVVWLNSPKGPILILDPRFSLTTLCKELSVPPPYTSCLLFIRPPFGVTQSVEKPNFKISKTR